MTIIFDDCETALEGGFSEVDGLPVAAFDTGSDLCRSLAFHGLLVGVGSLAHAGGAGGSVSAFEAAV